VISTITQPPQTRNSRSYQRLAAPRLVDAQRGKEHHDQQAVERQRNALHVVQPQPFAVMQRCREHGAERDHGNVDDSR
jgi:hypothetical protein